MVSVGRPTCVIVMFWPAIVTLPVRELELVLAATVMLSNP